MFNDITNFFGVYKSDSDYDENANNRMVFTKEDSYPVSKKIRFDPKQNIWIASNEAPGTIPKPFWYSEYGGHCLASIGNKNKQKW